jgi:hypothetical protein
VVEGGEGRAGRGDEARRGVRWERRRHEKRAALGEEMARGASVRAGWVGAGIGLCDTLCRSGATYGLGKSGERATYDCLT